MTEQELRARQDEAKRRVMEMQSRSHFAADQMRRDLEGPGPDTQARSGDVHTENGGKPDREELERLFILSLCLLLSQEEADPSVMLGLMYLLT